MVCQVWNSYAEHSILAILFLCALCTLQGCVPPTPTPTPHGNEGNSTTAAPDSDDPGNPGPAPNPAPGPAPNPAPGPAPNPAPAPFRLEVDKIYYIESLRDSGGYFLDDNGWGPKFTKNNEAIKGNWAQWKLRSLTNEGDNQIVTLMSMRSHEGGQDHYLDDYTTGFPTFEKEDVHLTRSDTVPTASWAKWRFSARKGEAEYIVESVKQRGYYLVRGDKDNYQDACVLEGHAYNGNWATVKMHLHQR